MNLAIHFRHKKYIYSRSCTGRVRREKTRNDVSASHFEGCECLWCHLNDDLRQILPVVFPQFLMACGFLIGPLTFSPLLSTHIGGARQHCWQEPESKQQLKVYIVVAYINHIYVYSHIHISWYSVVDLTCYLQISECLPDLSQQRLSSVLSFILVGSVYLFKKQNFFTSFGILVYFIPPFSTHQIIC